MNSFTAKSTLRSDLRFLSRNPFDGTILGEFPMLADTQIQEKIDQGKETYQQFWQHSSLKFRISRILKLENQLGENLEKFARIITLEMGKPIAESRAEIQKCRLLCRHFAEKAPEYLAAKKYNSQDHLIYQPLGGVLGVMPWNFPFWQVFRFAVPALLAGNVVFLKPAPNVPQCGLAIEALFAKVFPGESVFSTLLISEEQVKKVIKIPFIQGVAFTGSEQAGSIIGRFAGEHIKKCILELGGSDAFVVLEDSDVEKAATAAVLSRMKNAGQTCISAKRMIVHQRIFQPFAEAVCRQMAAYKIENPLEENTKLSVLARPDLREKLEKQVNLSIQMGAKVLLEGGASPQQNDRYFSPMVITDVKPGMPLYEEEVFGPVAVIFKVANEEQAIALANDTRFGLGASVWSDTPERAKNVAHQLEVGALAVNQLLSSRPSLPFGGIKRSGIGKELGKEGILEFVNAKLILGSNW